MDALTYGILVSVCQAIAWSRRAHERERRALTDEQEIPLRRELDFLQCYLDIEQARFGERLRIERDIAPETLTAFVPTLLLQPLIENSIRHGLGPQTEPGEIRLGTRLNGESLHLEISDNGVGLENSNKTDKGIGLTNTRARLRELYGDRQRFTLREGDHGGCTVEIEIPYRTH